MRRLLPWLCLAMVLLPALTRRAPAWPSVYPTGTTIHDTARAEDGFVLFAPLDNDPGSSSGLVYLINMSGQVVHQWNVPFAPLHARLQPDGHLVVIGRNDKQAPERPGIEPYAIGGVAGWLVELDWDGKLVFKHVDLAMHHDFVKLDNGHYLYLAWEPVPAELAAKVRGGIKGSEFAGGVMFNDKLVEIDEKGAVVWQWHASAHFDPDLDIIGPLYKRQEWFHGNSVWALADGNIAVTGRHTDSLLVIEKSTGKILNRWGNTAYLDKSTGQIEYRSGPETLGGPHDVRQIPPGFPGAGNLTCYDNGVYRSASRAVEIEPASGKLHWQSPCDNLGRKHYADFISSVQRLPRGNTLICAGSNGRFFQLTPDNKIVWEFVSPFVTTPRYQGAVFKIHFYGPGYCRQLAALPVATATAP